MGGNGLTGTIPWSFLFNGPSLKVLKLGCCEVDGYEFCNQLNGSLPTQGVLTDATSLWYLCAPNPRCRPTVWKAASSKAEPRQQQDWS